MQTINLFVISVKAEQTQIGLVWGPYQILVNFIYFPGINQCKLRSRAVFCLI